MMTRVPYRWCVAFALVFAYSIQYLDRVIATVLTPRFAGDIGLTTADIGTGAFLMMIFYGPAQVISGVLTDRFGAKRLLLFSIVAWSLMAGWMGLIKSPAEYFFRMALFGLLIGTEFVPSARIFRFRSAASGQEVECANEYLVPRARRLVERTTAQDDFEAMFGGLSGERPTKNYRYWQVGAREWRAEE